MVKRYLKTPHKYYPEEVPAKGVVTAGWSAKLLERVDGKTKINRKYYELCVLEKLGQALKCKEIWVEGSYAFRNPNEDLPPDWQDEKRRAGYYQSLHQPMEVRSFAGPIRQQMVQVLTAFNNSLLKDSHAKITLPGGEPERGVFFVQRLKAQPEPQSLAVIKEAIQKRYGMMGLLDLVRRLIG